MLQHERADVGNVENYLRKTMRERIMYLDGAMGTMIQVMKNFFFPLFKFIISKQSQ